MSLRIRQIVVAAHDLATTVAHFQEVLGVRVCYRDPQVETFGLENALMPIGDQFLEVVSPIRPGTAVGRHLERHGDCGYMLILQTDDFAGAEARLEHQRVRIVWRAAYPDIRAMHLHPKDIGGALVSIDEASPPGSWRWAGPNWEQYATPEDNQQVIAVTLFARDPRTMSERWVQVLGTDPPLDLHDGSRIEIDRGSLEFVRADSDVIGGFRLSSKWSHRILEAARSRGLPWDDHSVSIAGTRFQLAQAR